MKTIENKTKKWQNANNECKNPYCSPKPTSFPRPFGLGTRLSPRPLVVDSPPVFYQIRKHGSPIPLQSWLHREMFDSHTNVSCRRRHSLGRYNWGRLHHRDVRRRLHLGVANRHWSAAVLRARARIDRGHLSREAGWTKLPGWPTEGQGSALWPKHGRGGSGDSRQQVDERRDQQHASSRDSCGRRDSLRVWGQAWSWVAGLGEGYRLQHRELRRQAAGWQERANSLDRHDTPGRPSGGDHAPREG